MTKLEMFTKLQELYDVVYEFTDVLNDGALDILDNVLDNMSASELMDKWFNVVELTDEEFELLCEAFVVAADNCEEAAEEYEDFED